MYYYTYVHTFYVSNNSKPYLEIQTDWKEGSKERGRMEKMKEKEGEGSKEGGKK